MENALVGSPSLPLRELVLPRGARAHQLLLSANWNFLSLPRYCGVGQKRAFLIFNWAAFIVLVIIFVKG